MKALLIAILFIPFGLFAQADLPAFSFTSIEGKVVSPESLPKNKPLIVFYFDPFCDHCLQQAEWIKQDLDKFKGVALLWVSWGTIDDLKDFKAKYFNSATNVIVTQDQNFSIDSLFGYSEVPTTFVYNREWKQVAKFSKETPVNELLRLFE